MRKGTNTCKRPYVPNTTARSFCNISFTINEIEFNRSYNK